MLTSTPNQDENVLIRDSTADQSVIGKEWRILYYTVQNIQIDGFLIGMEGEKYPVVCMAAVVEDNTTSKQIIIIVNQAAYNKDARQHESLLHTEQARMHNVKINDLASCFWDGFRNQGKQCIETEGQLIPLLHDGSKYFLRIREPTDAK